MPRTGAAHTQGLSTAELAVEPDGHVEARLTFATAEPLAGTPLRDDDLRSFVLNGVDVTADGARCEATFAGSTVTEVDGLQLDASYACPAGAREIGVTLYYLSALRPGHREIARIIGPAGSNASVGGVLTGDRRALTLTLPPSASTRSAANVRLGRRLLVLTAAFATFMLALFVWRWRATRGQPRRR